jgi:serine/threonine protein kinase
LLLTGENPFDSDDKNMSDDDNEQKFFINRWYGNYKKNIDRYIKLSAEAKEFIKLIFEIDQEKRISIDDAISHDWIKKHNEQVKYEDTHVKTIEKVELNKNKNY